jgi:acyl-CoA dehydrogenase
MDFEFPDDTLMLRDMLRRFLIKEARPLEMKFFNTGMLEREERARLRKAIEQLGLWGILAPEAFGGGGLDLVTTCVIEEELGGTFVPIEMGEVPSMLYACREEQVGEYLEPALAGERRPVIAAREPGPEGLQPEKWRTTAAPDGEGFRIDGEKVLPVFQGQEDFLILLARQHGVPDPNGLTAFLLDPGMPGLSTSNGSEKRLLLQDCRVGHERLLGEPGRALALAGQEAPRAWIQAGARYVGMVERLIEMGVEHARDWVSLGAPLAARPAIHRLLAESRVEVESARWLVYHAAWLADSGKQADLRYSAAQVRLGTCTMLQRAVDTITMVFAGPGPSPQIEPQRFVRSTVPTDALLMAIERARALIAAEMLGIELKTS